MFKRTMGLGIDMNCGKIRIVQVQAGRRALQVTQFAAADLKLGAIERGTIINPEEIGADIAKLTESLKLREKNVVAAVGQPVYTRVLTMPAMKREELRQAATYQAAAFLPIPVEEAAIDVVPRHTFLEQGVKMNEVFFIAIRRTQVELLEKTCWYGGLILKAVEIEPLSLYRILYETCSAEQGKAAIINVGAGHVSFSVFNGSGILFYRDFLYDEALDIAEIREYESEMGDNKHHRHGLSDFINEIQRYGEQSAQQTDVASKTPPIWFCGNTARFFGLAELIQARTGYSLKYPEPSSKIIWPVAMDKELKGEVFADYLLALGLAARGLF